MIDYCGKLEQVDWLVEHNIIEGLSSCLCFVRESGFKIFNYSKREMTAPFAILVHQRALIEWLPRDSHTWEPLLIPEIVY